MLKKKIFTFRIYAVIHAKNINTYITHVHVMTKTKCKASLSTRRLKSKIVISLPLTYILIDFVNVAPTPLSASQVYFPFNEISTLFINNDPVEVILTFADESSETNFFPSSGIII